MQVVTLIVASIKNIVRESKWISYRLNHLILGSQEDISMLFLEYKWWTLLNGFIPIPMVCVLFSDGYSVSGFQL